MKRRVLKINESCFFGEVILGRGTRRAGKKTLGRGGAERVRGEAVMSVRIRWMDGWMDEWMNEWKAPIFWMLVFAVRCQKELDVCVGEMDCSPYRAGACFTYLLDR